MNEPSNIALLKRQYPQLASSLDQMFVMEKGEMVRYSTTSIDLRFTREWCKLTGYAGWGYSDMKDFHPELVFCTNKNLKRGPIEYRYDQDIPKCIIQTNEGRFNAIFPLNKVYPTKDYDPIEDNPNYQRGKSNRPEDVYQRQFNAYRNLC